jgi:hypothetical protein
MASVAEKIFESVKDMSEQQAAEVLNFVEFLKHRQAERPFEKFEQPAEADDWAEFEQFAGAWSGKFNREECYDRPGLR